VHTWLLELENAYIHTDFGMNGPSGSTKWCTSEGLGDIDGSLRKVLFPKEASLHSAPQFHE